MLRKSTPDSPYAVSQYQNMLTSEKAKPQKPRSNGLVSCQPSLISLPRRIELHGVPIKAQPSLLLPYPTLLGCMLKCNHIMAIPVISFVHADATSMD
jgi:hypothetical protein